MNFLPILDHQASIAAENVADIHLDHALIACAKILSSGAQKTIDGVVRKDVVEGGVRQFVLYTNQGHFALLPPIQDEKYKPWVDWCHTYHHAYWLSCMSWFLNKERLKRFGSDLPDHKYHAIVKEWLRGGMFRLFPRVSQEPPKEWDFPIVLPKGALIESDNPIQVYRNHYRALKTKGVKMKWTGNPQGPLWIGVPWYPTPSPSILKAACEQCGSIGTDPRMCPLEDCEAKKMYLK